MISLFNTHQPFFSLLLYRAIHPPSTVRHSPQM